MSQNNAPETAEELSAKLDSLFAEAGKCVKTIEQTFREEMQATIATQQAEIERLKKVLEEISTSNENGSLVSELAQLASEALAATPSAQSPTDKRQTAYDLLTELSDSVPGLGMARNQLKWSMEGQAPATPDVVSDEEKAALQSEGYRVYAIYPDGFAYYMAELRDESCCHEYRGVENAAWLDASNHKAQNQSKQDELTETEA